MITPALETAIFQHANTFEIPGNILMAMAEVESEGNVFAYRAEPNYRYLVDAATSQPFRPLTKEERASETAPDDFPRIKGISSRNTEWWGQQASWGPIQVMGAVAREYGFIGRFPELCTVNEGIFYGARHLAKLRDRFLEKHGWAGVVAAYNAGSPRYNKDKTFVNQRYVDKITKAGGL